MLHTNYFLLHYFIWRLLNSDCQHPKALLIQLFKYKLIFTRLVVIISGGMQGESGNARERWIERGRKRLRGVDSCVGSVFSFVFFIYWLKLYSIGKWKLRTTGRIKREQQIQNRKTHKGSMAKSNLSAAKQPQERGGEGGERCGHIHEHEWFCLSFIASLPSVLPLLDYWTQSQESLNMDRKIISWSHCSDFLQPQQFSISVGRSVFLPVPRLKWRWESKCRRKESRVGLYLQNLSSEL